MPKCAIAVSYCVHDDYYYLAESIASFKKAGKVLAFVSRVPWHGEPGDWKQSAAIAKAAGAEVVFGEWASEQIHRKFALADLRDRGFTHAFIPDGDEIVDSDLLRTLINVARSGIAERAHVAMDTYWKSPEYVIRPRERLMPLLLLDLRQVEHVHIREYRGGRALLFTAEYGVMHHLSYVGPDERIRRKITTWGHRDEVAPGWLSSVWDKWDQNKLMRNFHPTHPEAYGYAERRMVLPAIKDAFERYLSWTGQTEPEDCVTIASSWPTVSVVVPLYGGEVDIRECLTSLQTCPDIISETIVVDNASPDRAAEVCEEFAFVRVLRNDTNAGFAAACNRGAAESTGEVIVFLNSDTIVPRAGLIRLIESATQDDCVGAAGPLTNNASQFQQIQPTYTTVDTLDLFAEDFARRPNADVDVDMLVGFCIAIRRGVWEQIGEFDERFHLGMFEDNDLSYRLRRAGYRLKIASRSFIHHKGSQTLNRMPSARRLFKDNQVRYHEKWREDLESGFASNLSGLTVERILFDEARNPDKRREALHTMAEQLQISLCVVVHNGEMGLDATLKSAASCASDMVVAASEEIEAALDVAQQYGAVPAEVKWEDGYSAAWAAAFRQARGKWFLCLNAGETISLESAESIVSAIAGASPQTVAFTLRVLSTQEGGEIADPQPDQIRLVRRLPGLSFQGRAYERIPPHQLATRGIIGSCTAVVQRSSSPQPAAERELRRHRIETLLLQDFVDRPNEPEIAYYLGVTNFNGGVHDKSISWFENYLRLEQQNRERREVAIQLLASSLQSFGRASDALRVLEAGLQDYPDSAALHFRMGRLYHDAREIERARSHYQCALNLFDNAVHNGKREKDLEVAVAFHLGRLHYQCSEYEPAKQLWNRAIRLSPAFLPSAFAMFDASLAMRDYAAANQLLTHIEKVEQHSENWIKMSVRYAEAIGGAENGILFLQRAADMNRSTVAGMLLARRLIADGREREAAQQLRRLSDAGVTGAAYLLGMMALRQNNLHGALQFMDAALVSDVANVELRTHVTNLAHAVGRSKVSPSGTLVAESGPTAGLQSPVSTAADRQPCSVIVLTFNSLPCLPRCLGTLLATLGPADEVIFVDNASSDGTADHLRALEGTDPRLRMIYNDRNLGFSAGCNIGLRAANNECVVLLNPDTVLRDGWLGSMQAHFDGDDVGAVGPISNYVAGLQNLGAHLPATLKHISFAGVSAYLKAHYGGQSLESKLLIGFCLMLRRSILDKVGYLDEDLFLGSDDLELSWRLRLRGYSLRIARDTFVEHTGGASFATLQPGERSQLLEKSTRALLRKLERHFGKGKIPSSVDLFGVDILEAPRPETHL